MIKDSEWCGPYPNATGAPCFHTLTSEEDDLNETQFLAWLMDPKDPKVCTSSATFADQKADIEALCADSNLCDYQAQQAVKLFYKNYALYQQSYVKRARQSR